METQIPIFYPTMTNMDNFIDYIKEIEQTEAQRWGIVKIIPPKEWLPRPNDPKYENYYLQNFEIPCPILVQSFEKVSSTREGVYYVYADKDQFSDPIKLPEWKDLLYERTPVKLTLEDYWEQLETLTPLYGADIPGSLFEVNAQWNFNELGGILNQVYYTKGDHFKGLMSPTMYFGSAGSTFAMHCEDMDLYSVSYLHWGEDKTWVAVPTAWSREVWNVSKQLFKRDFNKCSGAMRHKFALINPRILRDTYQIPCGVVRQSKYFFKLLPIYKFLMIYHFRPSNAKGNSLLRFLEGSIRG